MSKLLRRAKVKLQNAKNSYRHIAEDDAYLDDCCYNLQQSIEMSLKFLVEMCGEKYVPNHDIRSQLNILRNFQVSLPNVETLRNMAYTINSWEAESRCLDSFFATVEEVDQVIELSEQLIAYIDTLVIDSERKEQNPLVNDDLEGEYPDF